MKNILYKGVILLYKPHFKINFRRMKLSLMFFAITVGLFAMETHSQVAIVSIKASNITVKEIIEEIEKQTDYLFVYNPREINLLHRTSVYAENEEIANFLSQMFENSEVLYVIEGKNIVLLKRPVIQQQTRRSITGTVTDTNGEPIIGANVIEKGTANGSTTSVNGQFTLNVPEKGILQISYIGFNTSKVNIGDDSVYNIVLSENTQTLDEIVVVGFGTQKKVNLTGSVATVDTKSIESRPVRNVTQMLQGMVPGLNISQSGGGRLDSNPSINIRGISTIGQGSTGSPLILIDGMEGDINALNPQDIGSISVLKDVSSSSIYGARAPFGVILITTKQGKAGKININYNNNFSSNSPMNVPNMMNSFEFATYFNDGLVNNGVSPYISEERIQQIKDFMDGKLTYSTVPNETNPTVWGDYRYAYDNVDWYDVIYKDKAFSQEQNFSVSGGNNMLQYYASGNYLGQDGLMKLNKDYFKRYTSTVKLTAHLTDWLSININNRYVREKYEQPFELSQNSRFFQDLARQAWPILPVYDPNGYMFSGPSPALGLRDGGVYKNETDWIYQQYQLTLEPIKQWKIFGEMNIRSKNIFSHTNRQVTYNHNVEGNPYPVNRESYVSEYGYRQNFYNTNIYTEYANQLNTGHSYKLMVGFQSELSEIRTLLAKRNGIIVPGLPVLDITSGTDFDGKTVTPSVSGKYDDWATLGYFGRINYDYKQRYLFEANLRYDGTSRFRSDKRWRWFPSVSIGWNVAQEAFWESYINIVNQLKFRASYGILGNQNTDNWYPTYLVMPIGTSNGTWLINGVKPNTSSPPGIISQYLTWEQIRNYNMGVDVHLFRNRLSSSFDYFIRYTDDMVGPAPKLPATLGTTEPRMNNTNLKTFGFEWEITWNDLLQNGLGYSARFLLSDSKTKILSYPNPSGLLSTYRAGQEYGEIWGYETIGIAKSQQEMDAHLATLPEGGQNALGSRWEAGDIMYKDLNGDNKISSGASTEGDPGDLKVIGNNQPRFRFALDLSADWKGVDIKVFFQGIMKRDFFQNNYYFWGFSSSGGMWNSTGFIEHKDYFRSDENHPFGQNLDSYYPRPLSSGSKNEQVQTRYLLNASYIRLKNLQIGYTIPSHLTQKIHISKLRIFLSGENIWTGTKMSTIFDPETIDGGYGGSVYPLSKVYSIGLNVNF
jgi:TonB-linked SusC/RagA family outer membrane protein